MNSRYPESIHLTIFGIGWSDADDRKLFPHMECFADAMSAGFRYRHVTATEWHEVTFTEPELVAQVRAIYEAMLHLEES